MCGILAIAGREIERAQLERGLECLRHRGPDDRGLWQAEGIGLAHARLAVIDLEGGHQPLTTPDGELSLVANGEFYEHDRHLAALRSRGHRPGSKSDSELVLYFYRELGLQCLHRFRGEFAFALWDRSRQRLFAARDRFGIKPLFYAQYQGCLYLASEVKALWAAGVPARWCAEGVFQSLHFCRHQEQTLFERVKQVPAGHYLLFERGRLKIQRYWDQDYPRRCIKPSAEEAIDEVGRLLEEAVRIRTRSDVPLACYLSGGVDSSSVLALSQLCTGGKVTAFTIGFDHRDHDESSPARAMAEHVGADFRLLPVSAEDLAAAFEPTVLQGESVIYNGHAPARFLLSQALNREGFKVALGGEGADELFAGYRFCQRALQRGGGSRWRLLAKLLRGAEPLEKQLTQISPVLGWTVRLLGLPPEILQYLTDRFLTLRGLMASDFLAEFRGRDPYREFLSQFPWRKLWRNEPVKQLLYLWMRSSFVNYVLAAERLDMAHAVELRLPFLDHRLFEYARGLEGRLLYHQQQNKFVLRRTVAPYLTKEVLGSPKKPFLAPSDRQGPWYEKLREIVSGPELLEIPFLDSRNVRRFVSHLKHESAAEPLLCFLASLAVLQSGYRL